LFLILSIRRTDRGAKWDIVGLVRRGSGAERGDRGSCLDDLTTLIDWALVEQHLGVI
jgi:hypothetical protein